MADEDTIKRRYKEFLDLMPITVTLAGLPQAEPRSNFTTEQIELRAQVLGNAFRTARKLVREVVRED